MARRPTNQRPPRPSKLLRPDDGERYPNLDGHPATKRALLAHRAMLAGMGRDEALAYVDQLMATAGQAATRRPRLPAPAATKRRAAGRTGGLAPALRRRGR